MKNEPAKLRGRKPLGSEKMEQITFEVPAGTVEELQALAEAHVRPRAQLARLLLLDAMDAVKSNGLTKVVERAAQKGRRRRGDRKVTRAQSARNQRVESLKKRSGAERAGFDVSVSDGRIPAPGPPHDAHTTPLAHTGT